MNRLLMPKIKEGKLSQKQLSIFNKLAPQDKHEQSMFEFVMHDILPANIIEEELGISSINEAIPKSHSRVAILADRLIGNMDSYFDTHRSKFRDSMSQDDESLIQRLLQIPVTENGCDCTVGEILETIISVISNEYTKEDATLAITSIADLIENATKIVRQSENNHLSLSGDQAQELRDVTNGLLGEMLFDLRFISLHTHPNYQTAKARVIAGWQATQYIDDILDLPEDLTEQGVSMFKAFSREYGEYEIVKEYFTSKAPIEQMDRSSFCILIQSLAPRTYKKLYELQQEKLSIVNVGLFAHLEAMPEPSLY